MGNIMWATKRIRVIPIVVVIFMLLLNFNYSVWGESLDSDFDGWSDEYERIIGTDPFNPDTDGDGIRDPDDPTPNGSFMNTEEVWEAFEFDLSSDPPVSAVGDEIIIDIYAELIDPSGGRRAITQRPIWLFVYVDSRYGNLKQLALLEGLLIDGKVQFSYISTEPGFHYFVAVINQTGISLGEEAQLSEIWNLNSEKRCGFDKITVFPKYYVTLDVEFEHVSPSYPNVYHIKLWKFNPMNNSEEYLAKFAYTYNPEELDNLTELYEMTSGEVYIYFNRQGGQIVETVWVEENGTSWNYTLAFPAIYSVSATKYKEQFSWDAALSKKYPYPTVTVNNHPDFITSIEVLYPDLLPGHTDTFYIRVLQFSGPSNNASNLYHNATGTVYIHVAEYYIIPTSPYIYYINLYDTSIEVGINGSTWNYTFTYPAKFAVAATYYSSGFSWYSMLYHMPYSKAILTIHDNLVSWVYYPDSDMDVFSSKEITVNRVFLVNINETMFHELFHSIGLVGIATDYPQYISNWTGVAWVDVYYLVDNYGNRYVDKNGKYYYKYTYIYEWAFRIHRESISINGSGTIIYDFNIPGKYATAVSFTDPLSIPSHKFDSRMLPDKCKYLGYSWVETDYIVNTFSEKECYFTGEDVDLSVTNTNGSGKVNTLEILLFINQPNNYRKGNVSNLGYALFTLSGLSSGTYYFYGMPFYDEKMIEIIEELGLEDFSYSRYGRIYRQWIGQETVYVRDLAIYSNHPNSFVKGLPTSFRVIVYDRDMQPSEGCWVTVELLYRHRNDGTWKYQKVKVFHKQTDRFGSTLVAFDFPDNDYIYYSMKISAKKKGLADYIENTISARNQYIKGIITTDKPMYHAGDTIHSKFLIWNQDTVTPFLGIIDVILTDPYDRDILKVGVTPNEYGNCNIDIPLAEEMPWGTYTLRLENQETGVQIAQKRIDIKHYELPAIKAFFETDLKDVKVGDEVTLKLNVEYMFGAPVTEGNVSYEITGHKYNSWDYSWWKPYINIPIIINFTAEDLENGMSSITFTVPDADINEIRVKANFWDDFGHEASTQHTLSVGRPQGTDGEVQIDIRSTKGGFLPTEEIPIYIELNNVISGNETLIEPIPNATVSLNVSVININYSSETVMLINVTTDENGSYQTSFDDLGIPYMDLLEKMSYYYIIKASYEDIDGNLNEDVTELKVYRLEHTVITNKINYTADDVCEITFGVKDLYLGEYVNHNFSLGIYRISSKDIFTLEGQLSNDLKHVSWTIPATIPSGRYFVEVSFNESTVIHNIQIVDEIPNKMTLTTSSDDYRSGDEIELTVDLENSHSGWIYFDIVAGDKLITKQQEISGKSATVSFTCGEWRSPIKAQAYIIDERGRLISDSVGIILDLSQLKIEITTDKNTYEPGETATVSVSVVDENGEAVPYPLIAISIVDAAVFEIMEDMDETGWFNEFRTPYILNRGYSMKTNWIANVWYPSYLKSESIVLWPDFKPSVYYRGNEGWDNDNDYLWYEGISVGITTFDKSMPSSAELSDPLQTELEDTKVREWFTETAFWNAGVEVDENGVYTWDVLLPDNIAQWRIKAIASTKDCLGAVGTAYINTSKDFFIEPLIPFVFYQDDEITFKVRIYNFNNFSLNITLGLSAGPWLLVFGPNEKILSMEAKEVREIGFLVSILESGKKNLTLIATDFGDNVDAVIGVVKIRPNGALKTTHLTGSVENKATETVEYLDEKIEGSEAAVLRLAIGYQGLLLDGFRSLGDYPYGCTEQTISKMLPNVLMWEYYEAIGELTRSRKIWLSKLIVLQIQRLYYLQHSDGGWGWWKADSTDAWMTAYVLFGLAKADEAGFYISPSTIDKAQQCLLNMMDPDSNSWPATGFLKGKDAILSAYVVNALAYSDYKGSLVKQWKYLEDAWDNGDLKDPYGAAFYVMALLKLDKKEKAKEPIDWFISTKTGPHWEAGSSLGGADETTGWIAYALAYEGNHKNDVRGALEWLADLRMPDGGWGTTSDTIAAMFAICEVVKGIEEVDMKVDVLVNGKKIKSVHVDEEVRRSQRNFKSETDAIDLTPYLQEGENTIQIKRNGKGDLFYEITVVQYLRIDVSVNYEENITTIVNELFEVEVEVDPVNSDNVDCTNLDLEMPELEGLILLSQDLIEPADPDGVYVFTNTYYAEKSGTYRIQPITVSYQLDAGERNSGIIRRYYGPIELEVLEDKSKRGTRGSEELEDGLLTKRVSKNVVRIGEFVDVVLDLGIPQGLSVDHLRIVDFIPSGFVVVDSGDGLIQDNRINWNVPIGEEITVSYTMRAMEEINCNLGKAVAIVEDEVIAASSSIRMISTSLDFYVIRELSSNKVALYEPVTVNLMVQSLEEPVWYVALEDYIGAGCRIDKDSIYVFEDSKKIPIEFSLNVQSFKIAGDKIVFFIRYAENVSIEYNVIPTLVSNVVVPSAKVYSMYDENTAAYSGADLLKVYDPEISSGSSTGNEVELLGPDGPGDTGITENDPKKENENGTVTMVLIFGFLSLLVAIYIKRYKNRKSQKDDVTSEQKEPMESESTDYKESPSS
jgi:uncharacterized protein YfaS (alpha-2-macroglobulin family)